MSVFKYNGVILPYPLHTNFSQEVVYDDVQGEGGGGNTDKAYTRFDISLTAVLNTNYLTYMGITGPTNPAELMVKIRSALLEPRRDLSVTVGGTELIPSGPGFNVGTVDAKNGPHPQFCRITQLTNETFLVQYGIVAHYWENPTIGPDGKITYEQGGDILYNRWSEVVEINQLLLSKVTRTGKYTIRSDNKSGKKADDYRFQAAIAGVSLGFLRESQRFAISPDGLSVNYQIVDQEVYKMPPFIPGEVHGAYAAKGTYSETNTPGKTGGSCGHTRTAIVDLHLWGSKLTSQEKLIQVALAIGNRKLVDNSPAAAYNAKALQTAGGSNGDSGKAGVSGSKGPPSNIIALLQKIHIDVDLYNNYVHVMMAAVMKPHQRKDKKSREADQAMGIPKDMTSTPGSTGYNIDGRGFTPTTRSRGTWGGKIFASKYRDASLDSSINLKARNYTVGLAPGEAGATAESKTIAETGTGVGGP